MADPPRPSPAGTPDAGERTHFMPTQGDEGVDEDDRRPLLPAPVVERMWHSNPFAWAAAAVLMLLTLPLLVECSKSDRLDRAPGKSAQSAAPAAEPAPEVALPTAAPNTEPPRPSRGVLVTRPAGQPPRSAADGPRQMVTKCIERGRVVYTQTGECAGSVTAVPIDADKNVVGADRPAREGPGTKAP